MTSTRAQPFVAMALVALAACDSRGPAALAPATAESMVLPAAPALATSVPTTTPTPDATPPRAFEADAAAEEGSPAYLADVNAVYLAAIHHVFGPEVERLVVVEQTAALHDTWHSPWPDESRRIEALLPAVGAATLADFGVRNAAPSRLEDVLALPIPTTLIGADEVTALYRGGDSNGNGLRQPESGNEEVRRRYPGARGVTQLSGIGFDGHRMQALVYVESGHGWYVLLARRGMAWEVVAAALAFLV